MQGNGRFSTDSQAHIQTSDGDQRTGMFHQIQVTVGDTACSVNGVLAIINITFIYLKWTLDLPVFELY